MIIDDTINSSNQMVASLWLPQVFWGNCSIGIPETLESNCKLHFKASIIGKQMTPHEHGHWVTVDIKW